MKNKTDLKKLFLNKETVTVLTPSKMQSILGGSVETGIIIKTTFTKKTSQQ